MRHLEMQRRRVDSPDMAEIRRRLPATWRIVAAGMIVAVGIVATGEVHRKHGVPLFLAAIGCGVILRSWALGVYLALAVGVIVEQAVVGELNFAANGSGDNLGAEWTLGVFIYTSIGAIGILLGIGLGALAALVTRLTLARR